jgi:putative CocE/NonD family hydrolase
MKTMRLSLLLTALLLACTLPLSGARAQSPPAFRDLYTKREYRVPMRDGTRLYVSVYVPKNRAGKHPILLERTPYGAGPYGPDAYLRSVSGSHQFVENGYIFAYEDVRGLGRSEGVFVNDRPLLINPLKPNDIDESTDTYDTIAYLVKNVPDNNGRVGLWGISYPGFYAGIGAVNSHPALKAASPQAPVSDWFVGDDFHHNGALFLMDAVGFARFGQSPARRANPPAQRFSTSDPFHFYLEHGTLSEITETYFKDTDGLWKYLIEHGVYDEYWQSRNLPSHMKNVHCAVMTVGGWFDAEDCWGALHTYRGTGALNKRISNTLVMGPWYHGMWAGTKGDTFGDMDWGQPTATYFQDRIEFPFFDACLRGNGRPRQPEAQVFETGANRWRAFSHWPPKESKETALYLLPGKGVGRTPPAGTAGDAFDAYVSDPADPVPYQGGQIKGRTREYMIDDQRFAARRSDVLTYQTPVLTRDFRIAGPITADLCVETTGTDADFVVKVIDVFPDDAPGKLAGYAMLLRADVMRAKFRNSYANPSPLTPGKVETVSFELADVCHTFRPGHRLMVQIQSSWFPRVDRNPQQFEDIYTARPEDFQKATIRIYHSAEHPSHLRVGVLEP